MKKYSYIAPAIKVRQIQAEPLLNVASLTEAKNSGDGATEIEVVTGTATEDARAKGGLFGNSLGWDDDE